MADCRREEERGLQPHDVDSEEPVAKKLRSVEPDVKVTVRCAVDDNNDHDHKKHEKSYEMYSQNLAKYSKFFDACLSNKMKETKAGEIILEDVSPDLFEKAIKFQEDPIAIRSMTPKVALELAEFYDKYEFSGGIDLCDEVLLDFAKKCAEGDDSYIAPDDPDLVVDAAVLSDKLNLSKSKDRLLEFIRRKLFTERNPGAYGATVFTVEQMKKLHPFFKRGVFDDESLESLQEYCGRDLSQEELESPLFPAFLVEVLSHRYTHNQVGDLLLSDTGCTANGKYEKIYTGGVDGVLWQRRVPDGIARDTLDFGAVLDIFEIGREGELMRNDEKDWVIVGYIATAVKHVIWKCPHSENLKIPPRGPWRLVRGDFVRALCGAPSLFYCCENARENRA